MCGDLSFIYLLDQNFLFTSKDEHSQLKAIDFGLSDFVRPGLSSLARSKDLTNLFLLGLWSLESIQ